MDENDLRKKLENLKNDINSGIDDLINMIRDEINKGSINPDSITTLIDMLLKMVGL